MTEWAPLPNGTELSTVKVSPEGEIVAEYPAIVIDAGARPPWVAVRATWTARLVALDGLEFVPGDRLHEFFSPGHCFNVFSIWSPGGELRGWYANVTLPAHLDVETDPPRLFWYDLYVDLIARPNGTYTIRDEDELAESGLATIDPNLHARILEIRDELIRLFELREFPFHETPKTPTRSFDSANTC